MEFSFLSLLIGIGVGLLGGAIIGVQWQRQRPQIQSAERIAKEHEKLKQQVADHFVETAERVNHLTDSYKEVMDHLRQGATTLVDRETLEKRLPQLPDSDVRVARIGRSDTKPSASHSGNTTGKSDS